MRADRRHPRIGDDQLAALVAAAPDVVGGDRRALADVGARDEHHLRLGDVGPRDGAAVHAERQFVGGAGRNHAQAAVVIDVPGAERDAREFAEQVGLLGGQRRAAVDRDGILAVFLLDFAQAPRREVQSLVPDGLAEALRVRISGSSRRSGWLPCR